MFAVFDRVRSHDNTGKVVEQQVLKLVRGGELLVNVPSRAVHSHKMS